MLKKAPIILIALLQCIQSMPFQSPIVEYVRDLPSSYSITNQLIYQPPSPQKQKLELLQPAKPPSLPIAPAQIKKDDLDPKQSKDDQAKTDEKQIKEKPYVQRQEKAKKVKQEKEEEEKVKEVQIKFNDEHMIQFKADRRYEPKNINDGTILRQISGVELPPPQQENKQPTKVQNRQQLPLINQVVSSDHAQAENIEIEPEKPNSNLRIQSKSNDESDAVSQPENRTPKPMPQLPEQNIRNQREQASPSTPNIEEIDSKTSSSNNHSYASLQKMILGGISTLFVLVFTLWGGNDQGDRNRVSIPVDDEENSLR